MDTPLMDTPLSQPQAAASFPNLGEQLNGKGRGKQSILGEQLNGKGRGEQSRLDSAGRGRRYLGSSPKLGEGDRRGAVVEGCVEIPFEWDGGSGDDEVYVYAYCPEMEEGVLSASAWRRSGRVQLTLPERWQGKEIHFYGFAVDEKGAASATVYIGALSPMETRQAASLQGEMSVETDFSMREYTKNFSSTPFNKKRFIYYKYVDAASGFAPPKESSASTQNPFYQPLRVDKKFFAG